ncbi:MAG: dephospho-CoA kinase [Planctomycetes bacterium]|nr:dephospho-CoA kinase [Planctomycetota bacterium]
MSRSQTKRTKPLIGLAGGIGAGKSEVARILENLGAAVIDSDRLAHEELDAPGVVKTLREWWGSSVCTDHGRADRGKIGAIIFDNPSERARLEALLYPRISARREAMLEAYESDPNVKAVVLDTPKLFEVGLDEICHTVIFVDADWAVRVRRVADARNWTEEELKRREIIQDPLDMKKARADHVISNQTDTEDLRREVERVFATVIGSVA